jgi:hypothetical protein
MAHSARAVSRKSGHVCKCTPVKCRLLARIMSKFWRREIFQPLLILQTETWREELEEIFTRLRSLFSENVKYACALHHFHLTCDSLSSLFNKRLELFMIVKFYDGIFRAAPAPSILTHYVRTRLLE